MKRTSAAVEETIDENDLDVLVSFVRTGEGGCISTLATGWRPTYRESLWSCLRESLMFLRQLSLLVS